MLRSTISGSSGLPHPATQSRIPQARGHEQGQPGTGGDEANGHAATACGPPSGVEDVVLDGAVVQETVLEQRGHGHLSR